MNIFEIKRKLEDIFSHRSRPFALWLIEQVVSLKQENRVLRAENSILKKHLSTGDKRRLFAVDTKD